MATNNSIHIIGNMGKDPEMSYKGQDGDVPVTKVSVAVQRKRDKDADPDWFNVVAFYGTAEYLNQYGEKGRKVAIEGEMRQNRWETEDGQPRSTYELVAQDVQFLDYRE
jgi:single-strand DNA-binding protein